MIKIGYAKRLRMSVIKIWVQKVSAWCHCTSYSEAHHCPTPVTCKLCIASRWKTFVAYCFGKLLTLLAGVVIPKSSPTHCTFTPSSPSPPSHLTETSDVYSRCSNSESVKTWKVLQLLHCTQYSIWQGEKAIVNFPEYKKLEAKIMKVFGHAPVSESSKTGNFVNWLFFFFFVPT